MTHQLLHANTALLAAVAGASILAVAAALLAERLFRRASAAARHALILAALFAPAVMLAAVFFAPRAVFPGAASPVVTSIELGPVQPRGAAADSELPCALALLWLAGAAFAVARTFANASRWRAVAARAEIVIDDRLDAPYALARSAEIGEPAVIGIVDPVIVLPAGYDLGADEMQAVFAHELAHIARRDNLAALAVQLVCSLFWFDPLHRLARRKLVELRERVCDDLVIARGCDPAAYVAALARSCERSLAAPAVACMSRLDLQERMESIMTHSNTRRWPAAAVRMLVVASLLSAAMVFAAFAPTPELAAEEPVAGAYDFDVDIRPHADGRFVLNVRIDSPDGDFSSAAVVPAAPDTRTISTSHGGKTYKVTVRLAADGSASGHFEVSDGASVLANTVKTFLAPAPAPQRVAGANMTPPKVIHRVEPLYTPEAKANRITGIVILELTITETGEVENARVLKPLPYGLDQAAVDAVRQWRFEPATIDGKPVPVVFNITVQFKSE